MDRSLPNLSSIAKLVLLSTPVQSQQLRELLSLNGLCKVTATYLLLGSGFGLWSIASSLCLSYLCAMFCGDTVYNLLGRMVLRLGLKKNKRLSPPSFHLEEIEMPPYIWHAVTILFSCSHLTISLAYKLHVRAYTSIYKSIIIFPMKLWAAWLVDGAKGSAVLSVRLVFLTGFPGDRVNPQSPQSLENVSIRGKSRGDYQRSLPLLKQLRLRAYCWLTFIWRW